MKPMNETSDRRKGRTAQPSEDDIPLNSDQHLLLVEQAITAAGWSAAIAAPADSFPALYNENRDEVTSLLDQLDGAGRLTKQQRYQKFRRAFDDAVEERDSE